MLRVALLLLLCTACAPSLESIYAPYRQRHAWVYRAARTGLNNAYQNIIRVWSEPLDATHSQVRVHIFPDEKDARVGARHTYTLDWSVFPPRITELSTLAGRGTLNPGLPLPDFQASSGKGTARYDPGSGLYAGQGFTYSWRYTPAPGPLERGADLELRSSLKITDSNIRLRFKPGLGIQRAEWKTVYGVAVEFTLESFQ